MHHDRLHGYTARSVGCSLFFILFGHAITLSAYTGWEVGKVLCGTMGDYVAAYANHQIATDDAQYDVSGARFGAHSLRTIGALCGLIDLASTHILDKTILSAGADHAVQLGISGWLLVREVQSHPDASSKLLACQPVLNFEKTSLVLYRVLPLLQVLASVADGLRYPTAQALRTALRMAEASLEKQSDIRITYALRATALGYAGKAVVDFMMWTELQKDFVSSLTDPKTLPSPSEQTPVSTTPQDAPVITAPSCAVHATSDATLDQNEEQNDDEYAILLDDENQAQDVKHKKDRGSCVRDIKKNKEDMASKRLKRRQDRKKSITWNELLAKRAPDVAENERHALLQDPVDLTSDSHEYFLDMLVGAACAGQKHKRDAVKKRAEIIFGTDIDLLKKAAFTLDLSDVKGMWVRKYILSTLCTNKNRDAVNKSMLGVVNSILLPEKNAEIPTSVEPQNISQHVDAPVLQTEVLHPTQLIPPPPPMPSSNTSSTTPEIACTAGLQEQLKQKLTTLKPCEKTLQTKTTEVDRLFAKFIKVLDSGRFDEKADQNLEKSDDSSWGEDESDGQDLVYSDDSSKEESASEKNNEAPAVQNQTHTYSEASKNAFKASADQNEAFVRDSSSHVDGIKESLKKRRAHLDDGEWDT